MQLPSWLKPYDGKRKIGKEHKQRQVWKPMPTNKEHKFASSDILVSKTDTHGNITYANKRFVDLAGYSQEELMKQPHNIVRHPKMPRIIFKVLWETLKEGKEINAYVVNLSKDGGFYWVFANVTPSYDNKGEVIGYHSTRRVPNEHALKQIKPLYDKLRSAERTSGMFKSAEMINDILQSQGLSYEELIFRLQYENLTL
jgi:PAS domain S-box-containing protein